MTFNNAAWAIDGATLNSALARVAAYLGVGGAEGIAQKGDLKVRPLDTPGNGIKIASGSGIILNRYQTNPDQSYAVTNPSVHTVASGDMPATAPADQSFIVAIVVGDPEFSQVGHPWMLGTDPAAGTEDTFNYVRVTFIPCVSTADHLPGIGYPALVLARLDIPASATTITSGMITDLRDLAQPRTKLVQGFRDTGADVSIATSFHRFPDVNALTTVIPTWAVKAHVSGYIEGVGLYADGSAQIQPYMTTGDGRAVTEVSNVRENVPGSGSNERRSYNFGGTFDVSDLGGTTQSFATRAKCGTGYAAFLRCNSATSIFMQVFFEEQPN